MIWLSSALSLGAVVLAVVSLALAVLRKWELARRSARWACSFALAVLAFCALALTLLIFAPRVVGSMISPPEPAERARILAQAIAELMNGSALSVPVLMLALPIWLISRNRLKAAAAGARDESRDSASTS